MALVQSMDIETLQKPTMIAPADEVPKQRVHVPKQQIVEKQQQHDIFHGGPRFEDLSIQRVDTPCPPALRRQQQPAVGSSYVLLPDCAEIGSSRRFIALEAGQTTVVGRSKSSGIRDHHVSRRHVEVTVPEDREEGSAEACCRIKYIGRNCRVVLVGGILLKAEQEVPMQAGTRVVLNYNNKGLPRYSYTLVPANTLPVMSTTTGRRSTGIGAAAAAAVGGRGGSANSRRWRGEPTPFRPGAGIGSGGRGGAVGSQQRYPHGDPHPHAYNHLHRHSRHTPTLAAKPQQRQRSAGGRFRKESQDKLQKERDEIFSKFADLKFV